MLIIVLDATTDVFISAKLIPVTVSEYFFIAGPNVSKCVANLLSVLSPAKNAATPPSLGIASAILTIALVASTDCFIASTFIPTTESEYFFNDGPNLVKSSAKSDKVLSPVNNATNPPLLGTILANSHNVLAAFAEAVTTSGFTPVTVSEYFLNALPKVTNSSANCVNELSPVNIDTNPPLLGAILAISVKVLAAVAVFSTTSAFTPDIVSAYCL